MKKEDLLANVEIAELLATGKVVLVEIEAVGNKFNYQFAQKRLSAAANGVISAVADFRSLAFNTILMSWLNGISKEQHKLNIDNGLVIETADGDHQPSALDDYHLIVEESLTPDIWAKDGELRCSSPKMRSSEGPILLHQEQPIFRKTLLSKVEGDTLVTADGEMDKDYWVDTERAEVLTAFAATEEGKKLLGKAAPVVEKNP
jgi:hypothetical protein